MSLSPFCYRAHQHLPISPDEHDNYDDQVDKFFDNIAIQSETIKHEDVSPSPPLMNDSVQSQPETEPEIKQENIRPLDVPRIKENHSFRRRSMSAQSILQTVTVDDINQLVYTVEKTYITKEINEKTIHKAISGENLSIVPNSTRKLYQKSSSQNCLPYVSLAEAIYHRQKDTPERFHSISRKLEKRALDAAINKKKIFTRDATIPQSPMLLSKTRSRKTNAMSQKEIEEMEYREMKKRQVKANPIPKSILLGGMHLPPVPKRPVTHPEPFELTSVRRKITPMKAPEPKAFTARPAPKHIFEKPFMIHKNDKPVTQPKSPKFRHCEPKKFVTRSMENVGFMKDAAAPKRNDVAHIGVPISQKLNTMKRPCTPRPFSFEQRDKERMLKKTMDIKKVLECEKKMREFHANPIPPVIKKKLLTVTKKDNKENMPQRNETKFVARKPIVLSKAPFIPAKSERPVLTPCPLQLATESRAKEREEYDEKVKRKEEMAEMCLKEVKLEQETAEKKQIVALRQKLVHKANPIRNYASLEIKPSSLPLTLPHTPNFASKKH